MALTIGGKRVVIPGGRAPATPISPLERLLVDGILIVNREIVDAINAEEFAEAIRDLDPDLFDRLLNEVLRWQDIQEVLEEALRGVVMDGSLGAARELIRKTPRVQHNPMSALEYLGDVLPNGIILPSAIGAPPDIEFAITTPAEQMFNYVDGTAVNYARTRAGQLVRSINESNRLAIRQLIVESFIEPRTVDQTAEMIRQIVGLHPRWAKAVRNFHDTNYRRLLDDGLSVGQAQNRANELAARYRDKLIRRRAEMIARTEVQQAQNFGREMGWVASDRAGLIDPRTQKEWRTAPLGSRYGPPCPICTALRGTRVPWNGTFDNGQHMPPAHPNCRCTAVLVPPPRGLTGLPSQRSTESWIPELERLEAEQIEEFKARQAEEMTKHQRGKHDQQSHGAWAKGRADAIRDAARTGQPTGITKDDLAAIRENPAAYGFVASDFTRQQQMRDMMNEDDEAAVRGMIKSLEDGLYKREARQARYDVLEDGLSPEDQEDLVTYFETIRNEGTVFVAADPVAAAKIVTKGEFDTVFETNRSNGVVAYEARRREEFASHDLHPSLDPDLRPIYGYVAFDNPVVYSVAQYGDVRFELKSEVKIRSTMTDGDSLGSYATPVPMSGDPITRRDAIAGSMGWSGLADQGAMTPTETSEIMDTLDNSRGSYVEAQIKGGVKLDDVVRIHVEGSSSGYGYLQAAAEQKNIEIVFHGEKQ